MLVLYFILSVLLLLKAKLNPKVNFISLNSDLVKGRRPHCGAPTVCLLPSSVLSLNYFQMGVCILDVIWTMASKISSFLQ